MNRMKHSLLRLLLAIALPLAPIWHAMEHAEDASHARPLCSEQGAGQQHWHQAPAVSAPCEACQALSQHSFAPSAQALPQAELTLSSEREAGLAAPISLEFLYFDHRGPPQQA